MMTSVGAGSNWLRSKRCVCACCTDTVVAVGLMYRSVLSSVLVGLETKVPRVTSTLLHGSLKAM